MRTKQEVKKLVKDFLKAQPLVKKIIHVLNQSGGRSLLVGGSVRDLFLGATPKDFDIEVYGLKIGQIQKILSEFGTPLLVGKSFGVIRLSGLDVDWSVPRKDSHGRKPLVQLNEMMDFDAAFARRDLTINAMGIDLVTGELIDPCGGLQDLRVRRLRAPDKELFAEDPLRFFRVMQFVGRLDGRPDKELNNVCARMDISGVSRERIEQEFKKLFLKSRRPSRGIAWLRTVGRLKEIMPEVGSLIGVKQDAVWHPEGDAYTHTLQVLDAVAQIKTISEHEKLMLSWAALGHDTGKVSTSVAHKDGRVSAHGHELVSVSLTKKLLKRFTRERELVLSVCKIVRYHMLPGQFANHDAKPAAYKRLANKLAPEVTLELLAHFACADKRARNPRGPGPLRSGCRSEKLFTRRARYYAVLCTQEEPVLRGRDLLDVVKPGPSLGAILKKAYTIQINEGVTSKAELKNRVLKDYN